MKKVPKIWKLNHDGIKYEFDMTTKDSIASSLHSIARIKKPLCDCGSVKRPLARSNGRVIFDCHQCNSFRAQVSHLRHMSLADLNERKDKIVSKYTRQIDIIEEAITRIDT